MHQATTVYHAKYVLVFYLNFNFIGKETYHEKSNFINKRFNQH